MQQPQPQSQRGRIVSAFQNDYNTQNQKRTGNGPSTQYSKGGGSKKRTTYRKKPFNNTYNNNTYNNNNSGKNVEKEPIIKGKGTRPKYYPNKTLVINKNKKNFNNNIEETGFSFKNSQPLETNDFESNTTNNVVDLTQNNIVDNETREQRFNSNPFGNQYLKMKKQREQLRKYYINKGLIDDPDKPRRLEDAIPFVGECQDMCPEFERYEREYQKNLDKLEINQELSTDEVFYVDHAKAVKRYQRSDAGKEQPLPCDVRPPNILKMTLNYLIDEILMKHGIEATHGFVRDRTRSIRQDFSLQNIRDKSAVDAHERIARYHILCLHQLCEKEGFSVQQEKEQLFKVLQSLQEFYDEGQENGTRYPNEAEFRAYYIISHIFDNDIVRKAELYPKEIFFHPLVQLALDFQSLTDVGKFHGGSLNLYTRIFKKIFSPETPYLMACLMEIHFNIIRKNALIAMNYAVKYKDNVLPPYPAEKLKEILGFDTIEDLLDVLDYYSIEVESHNNFYGVIFDKKKRIIEPEVSLNQKRTERLERKRENITDKEIINGGELNDDMNETKSTFSFAHPSMANVNKNTPFSNSSNNNNNFVGFSFNNQFNNMNDDNMVDVNMESNGESNNENNSLFSNNNNLNADINKSNNGIHSTNTKIENNITQSNNISFSFKQPQNDLLSTTNTTTSLNTNNNNNNNTFNSNKIFNSNESSKSLFSFTPTSETKSDKLTKPKSEENSTFKFTFGSNSDSIANDNNKSYVNNASIADKKGLKENNISSNKFLGNNSKQNNTIDFSLPKTVNSTTAEDKKSTFSFGNFNKQTPNDISKTNSINNIPSNSKTLETTPFNDPISKEKIKKENQLKFMENEMKRKSIMQSMSSHSHNMNVRPKPQLDELIVKTMQKRKEVEVESKMLYEDLIKDNTESIINSTIQEEFIIQSLYSEIITSLLKDILKEEIKENKKDETLLNNYYDALEISAKDILNEALTEELNILLKTEYHSLRQEYEAKKLKMKKILLKRQKSFFNERIKYQRMKQIFSKWNYITKLKINERKAKEEKARMEKLAFDHTMKLMEIGPGLNPQQKKNKEFVFNTTPHSTINLQDETEEDNYYLDYDEEEEQDQKLLANSNTRININDIAVSFMNKQLSSFADMEDTIIYIKILTSLPKDSKNVFHWVNHQFKIGSMENCIMNLSPEKDDFYYDVDDDIQFSQDKLRNEKELSMIIQNIPYSQSNKMEWHEEEEEEEEEVDDANDDANGMIAYEDSKINYASAGLFVFSIYSFQQDSDPEEVAHYWEKERKRFTSFLQNIQNYSEIPLIMLYWKFPKTKAQQFIQDAKYYLRINQLYNDQQLQKYQFLSIPCNENDTLSMPNNNNNNNNSNNYNNKIEKLNIGMTWLIENCHLYTLSSNVMTEIIQNNFYAMFLTIILKPIENEIPYGVFTIENSSWFSETMNTIIQAYNNIISAIIEFLYSSQVQYIGVKKKKEVVEYEDSEDYLSAASQSHGSLEIHPWLKTFELIQRKINHLRLPEFHLIHPLPHNQIETEETLFELWEHYVHSIPFFKSRQKWIITKEMKQILEEYLIQSDHCKFPYYRIFNLIVKHTLNNLQEILNDYKIYFIKYNVTRHTEEIHFFEYLLEKYKESLYDLLNQWSNFTLSKIEKAYFNHPPKRPRTTIETTWDEISKKYQRSEPIKVSKIENREPLQPKKKKIKSIPSDLKQEQKLLKDLINNVKKEFPFLKRS